MTVAAHHDDTEVLHSVPALKANAQYQHLATGSVLYRQGEDRRGVFKVRLGTIAITRHRTGRPNAIVQLAGPGDFVGLGFLDQYTESAQAVVDSVVVASIDFLMKSLREVLIV